VIEPRGLIGFALTFVTASWLISMLLGGAVLLAGGWLRRSGAGADRRAAASAIVLPPLLGLMVVAVLAGYSAFGAWFGVVDHCPVHDHHLHLCLFHGAEWTSQVWAVTAVAFLGTLGGVRVIHHAAGLWRARLDLRRIARVSRRVDSPVGELLLAPASRRFCFVAGLIRPRIFVSTAAWECLDDEERLAMLTHERAHADQGDMWKRSALGLLATFGAPVVAAHLVARWSRATERLCDHRAASAPGGPDPVARALVNLSGARATRPAISGACFVPTARDLVDRVEAVLSGAGDGRVVAQRIGLAVALGSASAVAAATALAHPIHHAFETLLGRI
jgi:Zn-dependent protease with chaperone function